MLRALFVFIIGGILLAGCTQRVICPAYQSAFIYDKEALRKKFSIFQEDDSTPKVFAASKTKYLIAEPVSYRKKIRSMQTIEMKPVYVQLPDSLQPGYDPNAEDGVVPGAELDAAARSVIDSIYIVDVPKDTAQNAEDSVYMITRDKEIRVLKYDMPDSLILDPATGKWVRETPRYYVTQVTYNVDQDSYMWYLRDYLVLPDVRMAQQQRGDKAKAEAKAKKSEKGIRGFFKHLFGKKKKHEVDSAALRAQQQPKEEFDYVDEDEQLKDPAQQTAPPAKKGGLFSKFKKKNKTTAPPTDAPAEEKPKKSRKEKKAKTDQPAGDKPKPDDDDGF